MNKVDTLIIGAGVSGLTYALYTNRDYLIVEKEKTPGGLCRTFYQNDFVWDYAGHFFHFATPEFREFFEKRIKKNDMVKCKKNTNINYNGSEIHYPFQMNIHELPKDEFIDCLFDLFNRKEKDLYSSFEDMLYGKFGRSITEKFLKPYNEKLYACDLNDLDTDAMGRFFPYADPRQIINNMRDNDVRTYNSTFDYPKRGAQLFIDVLLENINLSNLKLNSRVESIDLKDKKAVIDGEVYCYNTLINTIPLNHFVGVVNYQGAFELKNSLSCNKVLVFNLGFDRMARDRNIHWTYVPMKTVNFYRMGYYSNILGTDKLSMYIEIGFKEDEEIDIEYHLQETLNNLKLLGVIDEHKLEAHNALVINPGYVHITKDSISSVSKFINYLKQYDAYTIGRYGKWTYCSIEDCMVDAKRLAGELDG